MTDEQLERERARLDRVEWWLEVWRRVDPWLFAAASVVGFSVYELGGLAWAIPAAIVSAVATLVVGGAVEHRREPGSADSLSGSHDEETP